MSLPLQDATPHLREDFQSDNQYYLGIFPNVVGGGVSDRKQITKLNLGIGNTSFDYDGKFLNSDIKCLFHV